MSNTHNSLLVKNLIEFGLSEKEAKLYIALLELEVASVGEISKKAQLNRSSTYVTLENLKKNGIVSETAGTTVQKFTATSPEIFLKSAENLFEKAGARLQEIKKVIPKLKSLHKDTSVRPVIRIFEGEDGLMHLLEETLNNNSEKILRLFSSSENLLKLNAEYLTSFRKKRVNLKIKQKAILSDNQLAHKLFPLGRDMYDVVFIPKEKYPFPVDVGIIDNTVGYLTLNKGKLISVVIENKEIAETMKVLFDITWREAERIGKSN